MEDSNGSNVFNSHKMTEEQQRKLNDEMHRMTVQMQEQQEHFNRQMQDFQKNMQAQMQQAFGPGFPFGKNSPFGFPFYNYAPYSYYPNNYYNTYK